MPGVEEQLRQLGRIDVPAPSEELVAADLARGARALRRRRRTTGALGALAAVVVAGTAGATLLDRPSPTAPGRDVAGPTSGLTSGSTSAPVPLPVRLVAYDGDQAAGFRVRQVPAGFVVQGVSAGILAIGRADDHTPITSFVGKLTVTIEPRDEAGPQDGAPVRVDGAAGTISRSDEAATLTYVHGHDDVVVQAWDDVPLTDAQLVRFAEGITVTAHAQESHG